jgi:hypothetical protein
MQSSNWNKIQHRGSCENASRGFQALSGASLDPAKWQQCLYEWLAANEPFLPDREALKEPCALFDLVEELSKQLGRPSSRGGNSHMVGPGAASRSDDDRPLLAQSFTVLFGASAAQS